MISEKELAVLASLARIKLTAEEKPSLARDIGAILDYVAQLKKIKPLSVSDSLAKTENFARPQPLREDDEPHRANLMPSANALVRGYVQVKSIFPSAKNDR